jgi:trimethylamine:corrinoid methyltransferase-like protein
VWYSDLFDRSIHAQWLEKGAKRFEERLREKTRKVMEHEPAPLPPEVIKELDRMAKHWE